MGYWAKIDQNNIVEQVIVADAEFISAQPGTWLETDYNGITPRNYAGPGMRWDETRNAFIPSKPYPSWILGDDCQWHSPIGDNPKDEFLYHWDELSQSWLKVEG